MSKFRNKLQCLVFALGVVLMTGQVSAEEEDTGICCVVATGACGSTCNPGLCVFGQTCSGWTHCSPMWGDCYRDGYGCVAVNVGCWDVLGCSPCLAPSEPDDSGEQLVDAEPNYSSAESVEPEPVDSGDESVEAECDEEVDTQSTLSLTALLIFLTIALPAAPMISRRWSARK